MKNRAATQLFFLLAAATQLSIANGPLASAAFLEHYPASLQTGGPAALRTGSPPPSSEAPSGATALNKCPLASGEGYQNGASRFLLSSKIYKPSDDVQAAIKAEYGENATIADWAELKSILRTQQNVSKFIQGLGLRRQVTNYEGDNYRQSTNYECDNYYVSVGNELTIYGMRLFVARHDGRPPSNWATLDEIGGYKLDLGRWTLAAQAIVKISTEDGSAAAPIGAQAQGAADIVVLNSKVIQLIWQGKYADATEMAKRALTLAERMLGSEHSYTLTSANNLALLYEAQGRYTQAEPLYKRALVGRERVLGKEHLDTLTSVNNLALLFEAQGRYGEAEPLFKRALAARERLLGTEHSDTLISVKELAALYLNQGRYGEADPLFKRALEGDERVLGPDQPQTLADVNNLAVLYLNQGRYGEAEPLFKRALEDIERVLGPDHPGTLTSLNNLAILYQAQGRYGEAEPLFKHALEGDERVLGREHPDTLISVGNLARLYFTKRDWTRAAQFWRRSTDAIAGRTQRGALDTGQAPTGKKKSEAEQSRWQFQDLVKAVYRLAPEGGTPNTLESRAMFEAAQWVASSEAAQSVAQMAARGARGNRALAVLVRERQDLVAEWQKRDALRNNWLGQTPNKRNAQIEAENMSRLDGIGTRIAEIDKSLATEFPDYTALASPTPLSVDDVQAQLGPDEALVLFLDTPEAKPTPEETFIWVLTKADQRWVRIDLGTNALTKEVKALRCGLDGGGAWTDGSCEKLLGVQYTPADVIAGQMGLGKPLPFDTARAHALYRALFGQIEDLAGDKKHLLVVPSGPLTALPFQVLVTNKPDDVAAIPAHYSDYARITWLGQEKAISVLPSVASLKALRREAKPSAAPNPYIAFANPLLSGKDGTKKTAWAKQVCPAPGRNEEAVSSSVALPASVRAFASADDVRHQDPLPETADEVCAVARLMGSDPSRDVYLGARATETQVEALSANGTLAKARVIHFATHGLLARETEDVLNMANGRAQLLSVATNGLIESGPNGLKTAPQAEPALVLTPPANGEDNGLLTASEVAALKLDADWVVLSACNTAAPGSETGTEALSGLARAFFYAGARALLVSHWYVNSAVTVPLITRAFSELKARPDIGRAEAMRLAMSSIIAEGGRKAHPANWAPFAVVGEGGAAQ